MTCPAVSCGFQFCWVCLKKTHTHNQCEDVPQGEKKSLVLFQSLESKVADWIQVGRETRIQVLAAKQGLARAQHKSPADKLYFGVKVAVYEILAEAQVRKILILKKAPKHGG